MIIATWRIKSPCFFDLSFGAVSRLGQYCVRHRGLGTVIRSCSYGSLDSFCSQSVTLMINSSGTSWSAETAAGNSGCKSDMISEHPNHTGYPTLDIDRFSHVCITSLSIVSQLSYQYFHRFLTHSKVVKPLFAHHTCR